MKSLRLLVLVVCATLASHSSAQSGVNATGGTEDRSRDKWKADPPPPKGVAPVDTSRTYHINDVEVMPQFPGGDTAMFEWILRSFRYTDTLEATTAGGRIQVEFVVERSGDVDKVAVRHGIDPSLDAEAVRVISGMPRWIPGKYFGGVPVACRMILPIICELK